MFVVLQKDAFAVLVDNWQLIGEEGKDHFENEADFNDVRVH